MEDRWFIRDARGKRIFRPKHGFRSLAEALMRIGEKEESSLRLSIHYPLEIIIRFSFETPVGRVTHESVAFILTIKA